MKSAENDRLYHVLENRICARIFRGDYPDGENLPPERTLAESFNVSRVTVRKTMALLEADGIIQRVQGSGNRVSLSLASRAGTMDLIAVLAPAQNVFFAAFIDDFQRCAEQHDSLVLFKQNRPSERFEESLFKLLQKNIRNAVIWLEDQQVELESIRRLRGLGMNMVFFDAVTPSPYADGVLLDNEDAITSLHQNLIQRGLTQIGYVGWNNSAILSAGEREAVFLRQQANPAFVQRIAWRDRNKLGLLADAMADDWQRSPNPPEAIICGDGEIGVAVKKALNAQGLCSMVLASPDEYPESRALSITLYRQNFAQMAEKTYECLQQQNQPNWFAATHRIKGELIAEPHGV